MGFSTFAPIVALGNGAPTSDTTLNPASYQDDTAPAAEDTTEQEAADEAPASSALPWKQPIDYGVVVDNSAEPLPAEGLACRAAPSGSADDVTRLFIGQSVEVTGQSTWAEGIEFLPVNCAGQGGYVKADYVQLNSENAVEEVEVEVVEEVEATEEEVIEEPAAEEVAEEEVTEEEVVEEEVAEEAAPVAGDLIVTVTDQNGNSVPDVCFDLYSVDGWVASSCDANDAIPGNGNSGFFGVPSGSYTVVATSAPEGVVIEHHEAWVDAGATSSVSVLATAPQAPVEVVETEEAVTEDVVTEEVVTEEVVTEEVAAEDVVTEEVADEPVASPTEAPAEDETANDAVSNEPAASPTAAVTEVAPAEATDVVTEEPATSPEPTETDATEEPVTAEAPSGPDLSTALGDATVTGTNGDGVRCRVAPDATSATIVVLSEGTTVYVLEEPANGFIGVACGNQLGYVDVNYMWAGGAGDEIPASAGSVTVVGTGGMSLNCRSGAGTSYPVVASVPMGSTLTSRGASSNGWAPVVCNGKNGYVSIAYVEVSGASSATPTPGTSTGTGTTGTVTNTGGDTLNCRTSPGGSIITRLPQGTVLNVRGAASNGWVPVVCGGMNGYVSAQYFTIGGSGTTTPSPTPTTTPSTGTTTGYVKVTGTGGSSLNCRSAASLSGMVVSVVPYGTTLAVRGAATNGWTPVTCGGKSGYVSSQYVTATSGSGTTNPTPTPTPAPGGTTGTATVVNTDGDGLRCRTSPGGSVITTVAEGASVTTRGASSNGWTPVICGGQNGYMSSQYLSTGGSSTTPTPTPTTPPSSGSGLVNGDHAAVTSRANMRYQASTSANVMLVVESGTVILITGGASNGYFPVDYDGLKGFIYADLLSETSAALSERGGSGADPEPTSPAPGGGTATGNAMANYGLRYVGYPYVWATHGPSSFDCSGFVYWVTKNVTGANVGTGLWTQWAAGTPVSRSSLQPGDIVFFQNTYKAGLSHVGIYIGNNQFVHAENENTGVRISDLNSTYYGSRWYGARRYT